MEDFTVLESIDFIVYPQTQHPSTEVELVGLHQHQALVGNTGESTEIPKGVFGISQLKMIELELKRKLQQMFKDSKGEDSTLGVRILLAMPKMPVSEEDESNISTELVPGGGRILDENDDAFWSEDLQQELSDLDEGSTDDGVYGDD
jgi:hypothetical protein